MRSYRIGNFKIDEIKLDSNNLRGIQKVLGDLISRFERDNNPVSAHATLHEMEVVSKFLTFVVENNKKFAAQDLAQVAKNQHCQVGKTFEKSLDKISAGDFQLDHPDIKANPYALFTPVLNQIKRGDFNLNHVEELDELKPTHPSL